MPDHSVTKLVDRVKFETTSTGTGDVVPSSTAAGYQGLDAFDNSDTLYYVITSASDSWEVGVGAVSASDPKSLARTTVLDSSNSGSAISLSGTSTVWVDLPANEAVYGIGSGGKMVNTSSQTISTGGLYQVQFNSSGSPGFAAVGDAVSLDLTNNRLQLNAKGLYQVTCMLGLSCDDAMGAASFWLTVGTGTTLSDQFSMTFTVDPNSDNAYGCFSTCYYCDSPTDYLYMCVWPDGTHGSSSMSTIAGTDRYEPKFSAVYIR